MAFASALGSLDATEAVDPLLDLLRATSIKDARTEFTLALARLVGEEHHFIQLQRRVGSDPGTALSQAVTAIKGKLAKSLQSSTEIEEGLDSAAQALAEDDLPQGVDLLCAALQLLPTEHLVGACGAVIRECVDQMGGYGSQRIEYVLLALHAFDCVQGG
jgi:hypothetical protein